jgi:hydrogenase nickel incorporation protein HypA/HybF
MHEFTLTKSILNMALEASHRHGGLPITRVSMQIGSLRQIQPDLLRFAFESASKGTPAEGAHFEWETVPAHIICIRCEHGFIPAGVFWICPRCGASGGEVVHGDELVLRSVTLKDLSKGEDQNGN